jgi:hypothetical protein
VYDSFGGPNHVRSLRNGLHSKLCVLTTGKRKSFVEPKSHAGRRGAKESHRCQGIVRGQHIDYFTIHEGCMWGGRPLNAPERHFLRVSSNHWARNSVSSVHSRSQMKIDKPLGGRCFIVIDESKPSRI